MPGILTEYEASKNAEGLATFTHSADNRRSPRSVQQSSPTSRTGIKRIQFDTAFAAVRRQPVSATRDAKQFGLWMRWQRYLVMSALGDGQTLEQIADTMGTSIQMIEDYLDAAPTSTDEEFFAGIAAWCGEEV